jgi:hypothetical protein
MGNHWSIHLPHLLEPNGTLAPLTGRGLRLAQYWTQIVAQASNYDEPATLARRWMVFTRLLNAGRSQHTQC